MEGHALRETFVLYDKRPNLLTSHYEPFVITEVLTIDNTNKYKVTNFLPFLSVRSLTETKSFSLSFRSYIVTPYLSLSFLTE